MRKTLGNQILENYEKNASEKGPEMREVTMEFGKRDFLPRMQKIAKEHSSKFKGKFYIQVFAWRNKLDPLLGQVKYIVRETRPRPEPCCLLYSYDKHKDEWKYEWMLPSEESFLGIVNNKENYHPHVVENIQKYLHGKLA